jgi:hypothetical protein
VHFLYLAWVRTSGVALVLWAAYLLDSTWFAQTALIVTLLVLLAGGILLLAVGVKDLAQDFWRSCTHVRIKGLYARSRLHFADRAYRKWSL